MSTILDNVQVVLSGTLYHGNVGSVCRAMANMGLQHLVLAAPQLCDQESDVNKMAVHAINIWQKRRETPDLASAVADCTCVVGTTTRGGLYRQHVKTPRAIAPELLQRAAQGRVALVFGCEDSGLSNAEIGLCTHLIKIPVDNTYTSLNLAQAVLLCCYELYHALGSYATPMEKSLPATNQRKQHLINIWREMLLLVGFMENQKADHMMQGIQRIFSRGVLTDDDVAIMLGVARQAQWAARQAHAQDASREASVNPRI